jgi:RNA polymerase sigma-70 factor (ECF subfamily)
MDPAQNKLLENLLEACSRRDHGAFARLYETTSSKLFGVAVRILRREDWAEEVLQDCYVSIWNHAASYAAGLSAPMTWMTSIVRNRCLDWLRRPKLEVVLERPGEEGEDPLEAIASDNPGPLEELSRSTDAKALAECLKGLEAKQRQAIMLAFFQGLSHSELAGHMRQPLGTVKTWVRRGLERLKVCLGPM